MRGGEAAEALEIRVNLELKAETAPRAVRRGDVIVAIDVLRCSSTIITALTNGAKAVIPVETVREAEKMREINPEYLLAGERRGLKPRGFDMGNSPLEFTREKVEGREIVLTTTSGTKALRRSEGARWVLVGAFLNARSAARKALQLAVKEGLDITLLTAGKRGRFSLEDFICAGAIAEELRAAGETTLSDGATAANLAYQTAKEDLLGTLRRGEHAQYLVKIGLEEDVEFCSQLNRYEAVPIYRDGAVRLWNRQL